MTTTQSHVEVNVALCRALGIEDVGNIKRVEIVLDPAAYPLVHVTRMVRSAEGMKTLTSAFDLVPHD